MSNYVFTLLDSRLFIDVLSLTNTNRLLVEKNNRVNVAENLSGKSKREYSC